MVSPELSFVVRVLLEVEVGRRSHDEVHRLLVDVTHLAGVAQQESVPGGNLLEGAAQGAERPTVLGQSRNFRLRERIEPDLGQMLLDQTLQGSELSGLRDIAPHIRPSRRSEHRPYNHPPAVVKC